MKSGSGCSSRRSVISRNMRRSTEELVPVSQSLLLLPLSTTWPMKMSEGIHPTTFSEEMEEEGINRGMSMVFMCNPLS